MWVGSQTSQVEIKLSLKACQVSMVLPSDTAASSTATPISTCCLSSAGLHPAHARKRRTTPQKTAAGAKGERAPLLHTMLPRLGCVQNSPLLNQVACKKMLLYLGPCCSLQIHRCLCPTVLNPSCDLSPTCPLPKPAERTAMNSSRIKVGKRLFRFNEECTDVL